MILIQLHEISFNFQNIVQLLEIYYATQDGYIFLGNMYNDLWKVMGVVPGHALIAGKVAGNAKNSYTIIKLCGGGVLSLDNTQFP